jgi:hypothetical protein
MTQDQYGQARGPGYVVRGDAVPDDENEEYASGQSKPVTRFQKVASALRGGGHEQDEEGDYGDEPAASAAGRDKAVAVTTPDAPVPETGTDPLTRQDQVTGQASPDGADHPATQPDMFGTTTHAGNGATSAPYPEDQVGEATNGAQANGAPAGAASADAESRPGGAAGMLGDFSDLTYGDLLPDAAQYSAQWQQVQFKFVDDPRASVTEAADIIAQVTARLEAAIQERQRAIEERQRAIAEQQRSLRDRWGEDTNADTEGLRETLRLYRTFLDQLIGPRAG